MNLAEAEKAYLLMLARRILNFQREAAERGEEYHDVGSDAMLECGASARMRFVPCGTGYEPQLWLWGSFTKPEDYTKVAEGILGGPVVAQPAGADCAHIFKKKPL